MILGKIGHALTSPVRLVKQSVSDTGNLIKVGLAVLHLLDLIRQGTESYEKNGEVISRSLFVSKPFYIALLGAGLGVEHALPLSPTWDTICTGAAALVVQVLSGQKLHLIGPLVRFANDVASDTDVAAKAKEAEKALQ